MLRSLLVVGFVLLSLSAQASTGLLSCVVEKAPTGSNEQLGARYVIGVDKYFPYLTWISESGVAITQQCSRSDNLITCFSPVLGRNNVFDTKTDTFIWATDAKEAFARLRCKPLDISKN
ncbi:hypothetical protein FHW16_005510 [Phyllobacterium myrsinacearum]|uniref:Uncharacterized protein n=1 Tax=Phyllobacterium myrsinacearum TaxID=28101 RepID=A0A839EUI3_9HYPH|nr:hypothetical protein [Phyllobacterium myrsinacearum]